MQESDQNNNTSHYEALRHTLISIDPEFLGILEQVANTPPERDSVTLSQAYIYSLSGDKPKLKGHILESTNNYGDKISVDTSKEPPLRELSLANSEYSLETNPSIGALHKPESEFSRKTGELNQDLRTINALQSTSIQEYIRDLIDHDYKFPEIKNQLKLVYKIDI
ncbi:hypothetical protein ACFL2V_01030 [Pseudomonadota bacterium]